MSEGRLRFNTRYTVMDEFDDAILSYALKDAFPEIVFDNRRNARPAVGPDLGIPECDRVVSISFPRPESVPRVASGGSPAWPYGHYVKSSWFWGHNRPGKWAFSLPTPEHGSFTIGYNPDIPEHKALIRAVHKVMNRMMTNRLKSGLYKNCPLTVAEAYSRSNAHWTGFHVLDWCRQDPDRMIDGVMLPCDDWEPPDNPWYQDLCRRVIARYGADYGGPLPSRY